MVDRVQAIKWESPAHGGTQTDQTPTELDVHEDHLECRGVVIQDDTSDDEDVGVTRNSGGDLLFRDKNVGEVKSLSALAAGGFDINNVVFDNDGGIVYDNDGQVVTET